MKYVDVILPLPLAATYTYALPESCVANVKCGCRVIVPFGAKKIYTAVVIEVHERQPEGYAVKSVKEVLDVSPVLLPQQLKFWEWIAEYYLCSVGEVFKAALPSGMKLESESRLTLNENSHEGISLTEKEQMIVQLLSEKSDLTLTQIEKSCVTIPVLRVVRTLLAKGVLTMREEVRRSYKPRVELHVRLSERYLNESSIHTLYEELKKAPKQWAVLSKYMELSGAMAAIRLQNPQLLQEVSRKQLIEKGGVSLSVCNALLDKGILESYSYEVGRLATSVVAEKIGLAPLSEAQQHALVSIENEWKHSSVCLLHGVTSSGKTEVYIHLIQQMIQKGKQVLYLVPEIALTTQLTERLSRVFGEKLGVYHSKFPDAERVEMWKKQLSESPYDVILGVRSSIFLPFKDLGLVIVDEEHEQTYKQQEPAPRYHARNAAIVLAQMYGAKTLLGTATPSLESYYNVRIGKYGLVEMKERFGQVQLPSVQVVDIKELQRKKRMVGPFSTPLLEQMRSALQANEQVILFQNRRGYAPHLECHTCGWVPRCPKCDVSLTYHKRLNKMTCHYCGYIGTVPVCCPACEEEKLSQHGYGTEKVEDAVRHLFPEATVARMDLDTTRTRAAYEQIISDFQHGRTNVLIGTQMVTKGLDFERVGVVGILNADTMMNVPDFRSFERAYQLMAQVAGRAGRRSTQGRVVLQTKSPELPIVTQVVTYDYEGLYTQQMEERRMFLFPPFCRLIYVYMKHKNAEVLDKLATEMSQRLRSVFGQRVLGPDVPPVARIQALYIRKIMIKVEPGISMPKVRQQLLSVRNQVVGQTIYNGAQVYYDVDPM